MKYSIIQKENPLNCMRKIISNFDLILFKFFNSKIIKQASLNLALNKDQNYQGLFNLKVISCQIKRRKRQLKNPKTEESDDN